MSVVHAGVSFGLTVHGTPTATPIEGDAVRHTWFGVPGELTIYSADHGQNIVLEALLTGFASCTAIMARLNLLQLRRGTYGRLSITCPGSDTFGYENCTLEAVEQSEPARLDGSGVNGWQMSIRLHWRRSFNAVQDDS